MIEAYQLCKQFGAFRAVHDISLTIQPGEVLALLGPNGAGKTTTVRMFAAILQPTSGWVRIDGLDVVEHARTVRSRVGLLTEYPGLYNRMRAVEYLHFFGALLGLDAQRSEQRATELLHRFGLWEARDKRLDSYSKGMKQKIALVRALIHDPPVLYLDEPTTAMDPQSARTVRDAIGDLRAADRTILLTTHNLAEAEALADRIAIISGGRIIAQGTMDELMQQLLGEPVWELRVADAAAVERLPALLADLVQVEETSGDLVRYRSRAAQLVNPQIIARLAEQQIPLLSLAAQPRSLEEVYLRIVAQQPARSDAVPPVPAPAPAAPAPAATPHEEAAR
jgi:ABC-2 type transport system ATP-binding protein